MRTLIFKRLQPLYICILMSFREKLPQNNQKNTREKEQQHGRYLFMTNSCLFVIAFGNMVRMTCYFLAMK